MDSQWTGAKQGVGKLSQYFGLVTNYITHLTEMKLGVVYALSRMGQANVFSNACGSKKTRVEV
jgi:hypothetical protein